MGFAGTKVLVFWGHEPDDVAVEEGRGVLLSGGSFFALGFEESDQWDG